MATIFGATAIAFASMGGKKEAHPPTPGASLKETIQKAKEAIPLGAGSRCVTQPVIDGTLAHSDSLGFSEEEQLYVNLAHLRY